MSKLKATKQHLQIIIKKCEKSLKGRWMKRTPGTLWEKVEILSEWCWDGRQCAYCIPGTHIKAGCADILP